MTPSSVLLADPVFQLNTILWSVQELPEGTEINPVLRRAGYYLGSIGQKVLVPSTREIRERLLGLIRKTELAPSRPDVWLRHATDDSILVLELKSHGFSEESSNVAQAVKLLVSAVDLAPSVGAPRETRVPGHLAYVTVKDDAIAMRATLAGLATRVAEADLDPAPFAVLSLDLGDAGVILASPDPTDLPPPAANALHEPAVVLPLPNPGDDPRPLYLVPWIPGVDSQDPDLRAYGLAALTARLLNEALAEVGSARPPTIVVLDGGELLTRATLGVFANWRDTDRSAFIEHAVKVLERALRSLEKSTPVAGGLEIDLADTETQQAVIERIEEADPADPAKNLQAAVEQPPSMFDDSLRTRREALP